MAECICLGDVWPRKGFIGIEKDYGDVLAAALQIVPTPSTVDSVPENIGDVYMDKIHNWTSKSVTYSRRAVKDLSVLTPRLCYRLIIVSNIWFDPEDHSHVEIRADNISWRWEYQPFATIGSWGLGYHLTNSQLRRAPDSWGRLLRLGRNMYPAITQDSKEWRAFLLALYERFIGMQYDIKEQLPHYVDNILNREELTFEDRRTRTRLFRDYVAYCKAAIEHELLA